MSHVVIPNRTHRYFLLCKVLILIKVINKYQYNIDIDNIIYFSMDNLCNVSNKMAHKYTHLNLSCYIIV